MWQNKLASHLYSTITVLLLKCILTNADSSVLWPDGTYGIPMPKHGCPNATSFKWRTGWRLHQTEFGSHSSHPVHLAGINGQETSSIVQHFCLKTDHGHRGGDWGKGTYCLLKKGLCPAGFRQGWIYWDDAAPWFGPTSQKTDGQLPEGEYDRNTKIYFCCRSDGSQHRAIRKPSVSPFFLFMLGDSCQQVEHMTSSVEWVYWADEKFVNLNGQAGFHPRVYRSQFPKKYTKLYYCYYTPNPGNSANNALRTAMTVGVVCAGVVCLVVFLLIIACIVQKIRGRKMEHLHSEDDPMYIDNHVNERMLSHHSSGTASASPEPSVIYRPSANAKKKKVPTATLR